MFQIEDENFWIGINSEGSEIGVYCTNTDRPFNFMDTDTNENFLLFKIYFFLTLNMSLLFRLIICCYQSKVKAHFLFIGTIRPHTIYVTVLANQKNQPMPKGLKNHQSNNTNTTNTTVKTTSEVHLN